MRVSQMLDLIDASTLPAVQLAFVRFKDVAARPGQLFSMLHQTFLDGAVVVIHFLPAISGYISGTRLLFLGGTTSFVLGHQTGATEQY